MVNKCSAPGHLTNHATGEKETSFELPKYKDNHIKWLSFFNGNDLEKQKHAFVCYKHSANHFVRKSNHRHRLSCSMNPSPTILHASQPTTNVSEAELERLNTKTQKKKTTDCESITAR